MPTFEFTSPEGKTYSVQGPDGATPEQAFALLSQQIGGAAQPQSDKYTQDAVATLDKMKAAGIEPGIDVQRRMIHGMTLGADNTLLAAAMTPFEMVSRGTWSPTEAYNYSKAYQDEIMNRARKNTGALGTAAEIAGGVMSGAGLANAGVTAARYLAPNAGLLARSAAAAADGIGLGGFVGAMEGNGLSERAANAAKGAAIGGAVGGVTPGAIGLLGSLAAPVVSNIRARINPAGYAESQEARAINESGLTPSQIGQQVANATRDGQNMFTVADAMGNSGQRMLSTVARAPGQGRTDVVDFLNNRQAGQSRRVANALAEGFDSPNTAAQTEARMIAARDAAANAEYGAVRSDANPVDVSSVIANIDRTLSPGVNRIVSPRDQIAPDSVEAALSSIRARLTDGRSNLTDFTAVQRVRGDLADAVEAARRAGAGNKARLLGQALRELDTSMENASAGFRQANANYAQASRNIEAVDQGRNAAMRGRTEDIIPQFRALQPEGQQGFRSGYSDPLIAQAQGSAFGTNAARPLTSAAFRDEAAAIAPMRTGNQMSNRLDRENLMFETRNQALGGSRTADNLADQAAMSVDPHLIGQVVTGNWHGALRSALQAGSNVLTGNTPAVRQEVARILLQRGNVTPQSMERMIGETVARIQFVQNLARNMGRGASGGLAISSQRQ